MVQLLRTVYVDLGADCIQSLCLHQVAVYRGTSLMRNTPLLGTYSRSIPSVIYLSRGGGLFLMREVPL